MDGTGMEKRIKQISRDIRSGVLLEENIPNLFNYLADHYNAFAGLQLAMHYFTFYEAYLDEEGIWSREALEITEKLNHAVRDYVIQFRSGADRERIITEVDLIRKDITKRMEALTAFTDIFQIYEYVLNRMEYRFKKKVPVFDDDGFAREILQYIFDSEDNFIINEKIKDMVGQLPVRITRQRYFDLLRGSFQTYPGAEEASLNTYLYMLRTSSMLYHEEHMERLYPGLWEKKVQLAAFSYKDMKKEDYKKALSMLRAVTLTLETETTVFLSLQEIVNEVYTILLCNPYSGMIPSDAGHVAGRAISVIKEINDSFLDHGKRELPAEVTELFTGLEGVQEEMSLEISILEDALYEVKLNHKVLVQSLMLDHLLQVLAYSQRLLSGSLFASLEGEETSSEAADEEKVEKAVKDLEEELGTLFEGCDRMISRAVMANTLSKMPVFFADHKEVMDYVRYSLERCTDEYEKAACYEIINNIINESR